MERVNRAARTCLGVPDLLEFEECLADFHAQRLGLLEQRPTALTFGGQRVEYGGHRFEREAGRVVWHVALTTHLLGPLGQ